MQLLSIARPAAGAGCNVAARWARTMIVCQDEAVPFGVTRLRAICTVSGYEISTQTSNRPSWYRDTRSIATLIARSVGWRRSPVPRLDHIVQWTSGTLRRLLAAPRRRPNGPLLFSLHSGPYRRRVLSRMSLVECGRHKVGGCQPWHLAPAARLPSRSLAMVPLPHVRSLCCFFPFRHCHGQVDSGRVATSAGRASAGL